MEETDTSSSIDSFIEESKDLISFWKKCFLMLISVGMTSNLVIIFTLVVFRIESIKDNPHLMLIPVSFVFIPAVLVDLYKTYKMSNRIKKYFEEIEEIEEIKIRAALAQGKSTLNMIVISTIVLSGLAIIKPTLAALILFAPLFLKTKFNRAYKSVVFEKSNSYLADEESSMHHL